MVSQFEIAWSIARLAHAGQTDRDGMPYILHPFTVSTMCDTELERVVALLHDVLEDSETTAEDLRAAGLSELVVDAVVAITRVSGEDYEQYLSRVMTNETARRVKIADLNHNIKRGRNCASDQREWVNRHRAKYYRALAFLDIE